MRLTRDSRASVHLDCLRGISALAVLAGHARSLFLVDYAHVAAPEFLTRSLYFATALGHQAVVVFFVLSGLLVGSAVVRGASDWHWKGYAVDRLCRLYVVLLPALIATAVWDFVGLAVGDRDVYAGVSGGTALSYDAASRSDVGHFLASAAFCQTILLPPFGSNAPLWSLANEFWYYVLFPMGVLAVRPGRVIARIGYLVGVGGIAWFVGDGILLLFPVWLAGAVILALPAIGSGRLVRLLAWLTGFGVLGLCAVIAAKRIPEASQDYILGAAAALWVYFLLHDRRPSVGSRWFRCYARVSRGLARSSYTLYLVHMPLLVFIRGLCPGDRWQPDAWAVLHLLIICATVWVYAQWFARLTEFRTDRLRGWAKARRGSPT